MLKTMLKKVKKESDRVNLKDHEAYCPHCQSVFDSDDGHDCWEGRTSNGEELLNR